MLRPSIGVFLLLFLAVVFGCEQDLVSRERLIEPFSFYGVLSPELDTQSVLVYPVQLYPTLGSPEPLDADVYSTDLNTGERLTWHDTVVVEPKGLHSYVYWAPFRAVFGHRYQLEVVRRSDGARSIAEVRIPEPVNVQVVDDSNARAVEVLVEGESFRALRPEVVYVMGNVAPGCQVLRNRFSYQGQERPVEAGWQVNINLIADRFDILFKCGDITVVPIGYCPPFMRLEGLTLHLVVGDAQWNPPGGLFDANILSHQGTLTNVENGFGFLGAGFRIESPLFPSEETLKDACFAYANDG